MPPSTYIKLSSVGVPSSVESNHLRSKKVISVRNALRNGNDLLASVLDDLFGPPDAAVVSIFCNFEPFQVSDVP